MDANVAPVNYGAQQVQPDVGGSFLQGVQGGVNLQTAQLNNQAKQITNQQQQFALQQTQNYQKDLQGALAQPTAQNLSALALKYPQMGENLRQTWNTLNAADQQANLTEAAQVFGALHSGQPDLATQALQQRIDALQAAGKPATNEQNMLQLIQSGPDGATKAQGLLGVTMAAIKPDSFGATFNTVQSNARADQLQPATVQKTQGEADVASANAATQPRTNALANQKTQADVSNTLDTMQNRAATFGLDVDKFKADTQQKLSTLAYNQRVPKLADGQGQVQAQAVAEGAQAQQMSSQASELAQQLRAVPEDDAGGGLWTTLGSKWRSAVGTQNSVDALRKQYAQLRSQGIGSLKFGGTMSNADLDLLKEGFPADNAPLPQVATWLDAFGRLQARSAQANNAKAEWISQSGSVGPATQDIQVSGVLVPKGMSFSEFMAKNPNLGEALAQPNIKTSPQQPGAGAGVLTPQAVPGGAAPAVPSYMKYATPQ